MRTVGVIGLGTAGSAVAAACAKRGLTVLGYDARALDQTGAQWSNGVPEWVFSEVGVASPTPPELRSPSTPFHLRAGWGAHEVLLSSVLEVDMGKLSARLQRIAVDCGAALHGEARVQPGDLDVDVVVDCSGLTGVGLLSEAPVAREDLCVAAQYRLEVTDLEAAATFFEARAVTPGEVLCFTGIAGGYSIVNLRLHGGELHMLTGSIPALGWPSGVELMASFQEQHDWVGERLHGGSRAIPLVAPLACVGRASVVAIGDSARMVHGAHGSGIAQQLLAAELLASTLASGGSAWDFNVAWQRTYGGILAGADLFRRFSSTLDIPTMERLVAGGVLSQELMADALIQRTPRPSVRATLRAARGLLSVPHTAAALLPVLGKMQALEVLYRRYPAKESRLPQWIRWQRALLGS